MKMSDSNSIIYLLLLSLDDLSDNFKKKNANINNKTIFLMIYASRKKATLHKKYTTSDNVLHISLSCNDRMNHQKTFYKLAK